MYCYKIELYLFFIVAKPVMETNLDNNTIVMEQRSITLSCDVQYAYPTPSIQWKITIPSSGLHIVQQNTSNDSGYKLYDNRSIEIYHKFMLEEGHIVVTCLATNIMGSNKKVFQLWDNYTFTKSTYSMYNVIIYIYILLWNEIMHIPIVQTQGKMAQAPG